MGYNWKGTGEDEIGFERVYEASEHDTPATINAKLAELDHVILQLGNYNLTELIRVTKDR